MLAWRPLIGAWRIETAPVAELLFTENETNTERLWGTPNSSRYVKDGINDYVVQGNRPGQPRTTGDENGRPAPTGHRTGWRGAYLLAPPRRVGLRDGDRRPEDAIIAERRGEADEFYASITPPGVDADRAEVLRQALAGMLWTKQYYGYDLDLWLQEHEAHPLRAPARTIRNDRWFHMSNGDVISMPDKWEYPWFAGWDLAFHVVPLNMVDHEFAKSMVHLMLSDPYLHPSGQIPAYEWNFGDVNPPVHAWATLFAYSGGLPEHHGKVDVAFPP